MDEATAFYQTLSGTSFTLLGLWLGILQLGQGGWGSDPARAATTAHLALKFFLPGVLGLASMLSTVGTEGLVWRVAFGVGGLFGLVHALGFLLRDAGGPRSIRRLALLDPLLYGLMTVVAVLRPHTPSVTALQAESMAAALLLVSGLVGVWLAFTERGAGARRNDGAPETTGPVPRPTPAAGRPDPGRSRRPPPPR